MATSAQITVFFILIPLLVGAKIRQIGYFAKQIVVNNIKTGRKWGDIG